MAHRSCTPSRVPAALQTVCVHLSSRVAATSLLFGDVHGSSPVRHHSPFHIQSEPLVTFKWSGGQNMGNLLISCFFPPGFQFLGFRTEGPIGNPRDCKYQTVRDERPCCCFTQHFFPHRAWLRVSEFGEWLGSPLTPRSGYFLCYLIPTGKILNWRE